MEPSKAIVLITGASGRVGTEITRHLLGLGYTVVATSRSKARLEELSAAMGHLPGRLEGIEVDLAGEEAAAIAHRLRDRGLSPNALINNAVDVTNQALGPDGKPTRLQWHTEFDLAVVIPYELTLALAEMTESRVSSVVNISSMYGVVARNPSLYDDPVRQSPIHYGVAKAAMIHLTRELAVRLAPRRIRVNTISYGGVEGSVDDNFLRRYAGLSPSGRMLNKSEVSASVAFLISEGASAITGHNLIVDGGWSLW